jgi:hypothetical protein
VRSTLRPFATATAIAALCALVFSSSALAHMSGEHKLRLTATETQSEFLDLGTAGPSLGDELIFSETLFRNGHEVGDSGVVCTVTRVMPPYDVLTFHCVATLRLHRGQITLQGLIDVQGEDDQGPFVVAITGGTGAFRGAGGEAVVRDTGETTALYKLRLDSGRKKHHR